MLSRLSVRSALSCGERGERVGRVYIGTASAGIFNQDCLRLLLPVQAARRGGKLRLRVEALLMQPVQKIGLFGKRLRIKRLPCRAGEGIAGKAGADRAPSAAPS